MKVGWEGGCWHWHYIPEWIVLSLHLLLLTICSFIIFHEPYNVLFNVRGQRETWEKNKLIMKRIVLARERRRRRRSKNLVSGSSANRSGGPFEVDCLCAVNSLRTCVISECKASLDFFLYLKIPNISSLPVSQRKKNTITSWYFGEYGSGSRDHSVNALWF